MKREEEQSFWRFWLILKFDECTSLQCLIKSIFPWDLTTEHTVSAFSSMESDELLAFSGCVPVKNDEFDTKLPPLLGSFHGFLGPPIRLSQIWRLIDTNPRLFGPLFPWKFCQNHWNPPSLGSYNRFPEKKSRATPRFSIWDEGGSIGSTGKCDFS